jgi:hypothetical protein
MNQLSTNASVNSVVDGVRTTVSTNINTQTSSSNFIAGNAVVTGSVWTTVTLGTLTDCIQAVFYNDNTQFSQSVIQISASSGGNPLGSILIPGSIAILPWSGSLTSVAVRVIGSYPPFVSGSGVANQFGQGNIQFLAQQS